MLTPAEVATLLGLKPRTVYDIPPDRLPRYQAGPGCAVRYEPADVAAYKASLCRSTATRSQGVGASSSPGALLASACGGASFSRRGGLAPKSQMQSFDSGRTKSSAV